MKRCIKYILTVRVMLTIMFSSILVNGGAFAQTVDDVLTADAKRLQKRRELKTRIQKRIE